VKRLLVAALAALALAGTMLQSANAAVSGRWAIIPWTYSGQTDVTLRLEYTQTEDGHHGFSSWSSNVALADAGIPADKLRGPIGPVSFTLTREPGSFACVGSAGEGSGAGQFTYTPNGHFDDALASRGLGRPAFEQSLQLAIAGATLAFIDQIRGSAKSATIADIVRVIQHGVNPAYIADLNATGYHVTSLDQLERMRDHGVSIGFIKAVQSAGFRNLSPEDLVRLADHGVREGFINDMRAAGYTNVTADQLVTLRDHGISSHFIADLASAGYKNLSIDDLIALRDHGVNVAFVDRLKSHGYTNLSVHDLIRLRDAGI